MRKKILLFSSAPFGGGVGAMTVDMAATLHSLGHEVEVAFLERSKQISIFIERTAYEGFPATLLYSFRPYFIGLHTWNWGKTWQKHLAKFDTVVVVCGSPYIAFPFLRFGKPLYVWSAVTLKEDLKGKYEKFRLINKIAYRLWLPSLYKKEKAVICECRRLWALSQPTMQDFEAIAGSKRPRISALMAPIDTDLFRPLNDTANNSQVELAVLFTGRYSDGRKDIATLIRAFAITHRQIPKSKLVLIGSPEPSSEISSMVSTFGLHGAVEFRPWVDRVALVKYYQSAKVFAISSRQEGLCISGLEAMACGLPVISTACGGPESYVQDGKNGFLVPVTDHEAMSKALTRGLSDEATWRTLSNTARKFVLDNCGVDSFKAKVAEISE